MNSTYNNIYTNGNCPERKLCLVARCFASYSNTSTYTDRTACDKNCKAWER
jgi:hypothetical protein